MIVILTEDQLLFVHYLLKHEIKIVEKLPGGYVRSLPATRK